MYKEPELKKKKTPLGKILNGQDSDPEPARTAKTAIPHQNHHNRQRKVPKRSSRIN